MSDAVQMITVADDDDDIRLDKWFKRHFPEIRHGQLQKLLRTGQVRVDGSRVKANIRVNSGQEIRIPPYQAEKTVAKKKADAKPAKLSDKDRDFIRSLVIYEDDHVIALNKPPGIPVQGGSKVKRHIDGLLHGLVGKNEERPKLVHRLDKDTSGVLLLAKTAKAAKVLGQSFKQQDVRKYYWSIVVPAPEKSSGRIEMALSKQSGRGGERMMEADDEEGKNAVTDYVVLEAMAKRAAWVMFWPRTGRTHQIRAHAALMGTPVLGDGKYGGAEAFLDGTEDEIPQSLHLHARRLALPHPSGNPHKFIDITAPLSDTMRRTWSYFGLDPNDQNDPFEEIM